MQANSTSGNESRSTRSTFDAIGGQPPSEETPGRHSRSAWWKVAIVLILVAVVGGVIAAKARRRQAPAPPQMAAQPAPETVLASVNGEQITLEQLEEGLAELPSQYRAAFEREKHEYLEELIIRKLLLREARSMNIEHAAGPQAAVEAPGQGGDEDQAMIQALLRAEVLDRVEVTEEDLRAFYEAHRGELPGEPPFEEAKDMLRPYAEQHKQRQAVELYVEDLRARATISRNEAWIEEQKALAADNPLDRALMSGNPVLADFGRGICIPCKMMKPILDDLKQQYAGKAEILIIEIDEYPTLTRRCGIRAIPTQIFYDASGNEVYRHTGFMPREDILEQLGRLGVR